MIDEEYQPSADSKATDPDLLLYDFFKHLTSLSVVVLGGVLIIAKDFSSTDVARGSIVAAMMLISAAGICAFHGSSEIIRSRHTGTKAGRSLNMLRIAAPTLLAVGTGYFLTMFSDSLL